MLAVAHFLTDQLVAGYFPSSRVLGRTEACRRAAISSYFHVASTRLPDGHLENWTLVSACGDTGSGGRRVHSATLLHRSDWQGHSPGACGMYQLGK